MLRIKTKVKASQIDGLGLFADQFIPKGTVTWTYEPSIDVSYTDADVASLSPEARAVFDKYSYYDKTRGFHIVCGDDDRFINHSAIDPNILTTHGEDVALRDIYPGEELTCDYRGFDDEWFNRRGFDATAFETPSAYRGRRRAA